MISNPENQLSTRCLIQVGNSPAFESKRRVAQFWKIKGKWNFSLEPGLHCMPVGRNDIHGSRTRQRCYMKIRQFCKRPPLLVRRPSAKQYESENNECGGRGQRRHPAPTPPGFLFRRQSALYPLPQSSDWVNNAFPAVLHRTLQLHAVQQIRGAGGTTTEMARPSRASPRRRVPHQRRPRSYSAMYRKPFFKPLAVSSSAPGEAHSGLSPGGTSPFPSEWKWFPKFPGRSFPPHRTAK